MVIRELYEEESDRVQDFSWPCPSTTAIGASAVQ